MSWGAYGGRRRVAVVASALIIAALPAAFPALAASGPSLSDPLPGSDQLPNGWKLDPAGTQVMTNRATTGVWMSPDGRDIYATTSGIFEEAVVHVDGTTLLPTPTLVSDTFQGVTRDSSGNVWVSGGPSDTVWQFKAAGPLLVDARQAGAVPDTPNRGIPVTGYPGNMLLAGAKLFVAGDLSVPKKVASAAGAGTCNSSAICSVVNVIDVSQPDSPAPTVHAISVGRDAFALAYRQSSSTLYVTNWADQTNPARTTGTGTGTVSVVHVNPDGTGSEIETVPVGLEPTGIALSPDGTTLAVADTGSDELTVLKVTDALTGQVSVSQTVPLRAGPSAQLGSQPVSVAFSPDGTQVFVSLAGLDAVEVLASGSGRISPIPQLVDATFDGSTIRHLRVGATLIPTAWYPDALAVGSNPAGGERLVVANLRGGGAGPGYYGQTEPLVGSSTEGSLSVIDLPAGGAAEPQWNAWTTRVVNDDLLAPLWDTSVPDPASDPCLPAPLPAGGTASSALLCEVYRGKVDPRTLHVVIIEAENKTFDSYFGDTGNVLRNANADPQWAEYGSAVTTNQHNLAETYSVDDNFWNEGAEASTLGHSWLSGSYTTLDRELSWGPDYSQNLRGQRSSGQYGATPLSLSGASDPAVNDQESIMLNPRQLLIDDAYQHGLSVRLLGTDTRPGSPAVAAGYQVPQNLWGESGSDVSTDLAWPDVDRASLFLTGSTISHAWDMLESPTPPAQYGKTIGLSKTAPAGGLSDYQKFSLAAWNSAYQSCQSSGASDSECQPAMPNLVYMQLPENHTYDISNVFNPQDPTPQSMVADNDYAIGQIVQGLSHSPFWSHTIVFVTEDDNQFTGDHVDIHRTFLLTAGGIARELGATGMAATQTGSFPSVDKTTEALLGLPPLTLFDSTAVPLQQVVGDSIRSSPGVYNAVYPPTPFLSGRASVP